MDITSRRTQKQDPGNHDGQFSNGSSYDKFAAVGH